MECEYNTYCNQLIINHNKCSSSFTFGVNFCIN